MRKLFVLSLCILLLLVGAACERRAGYRTASDSDSPTLQALQGQGVGDLLSQLPEDSYVTYRAVEPPGGETQNLQLLQDWVNAFATGESASLWLRLDGMGFPDGLYLLEADGTGRYAMYRPLSDGRWTMAYSSLVVQRSVDYVFGADLDLAIRYQHWQPLVVRHQTVQWRQNDSYNIQLAPPLGALQAEEAGQIAAQRHLQFEACASRNESRSYFAGGQYFPLDLDITGLVPPQPVLHGAVTVNDLPCYIIGIPQKGDPAGQANLYAVDADTGDLVFSISALDGRYTLFADSAQTPIRCGF